MVFKRKWTAIRLICVILRELNTFLSKNLSNQEQDQSFSAEMNGFEGGEFEKLKGIKTAKAICV